MSDGIEAFFARFADASLREDWAAYSDRFLPRPRERPLRVTFRRWPP